jgi:hypothetical protein
MSEAPKDDLGVNAGAQGQGRMRVVQVVQPDVWQYRLLDDLREAAGRVSR